MYNLRGSVVKTTEWVRIDVGSNLFQSRFSFDDKCFTGRPRVPGRPGPDSVLAVTMPMSTVTFTGSRLAPGRELGGWSGLRDISQRTWK